MAVLSELRYRTSRLARLFTGVLALILFVLLAGATISGFLLNQILRPPRNPSSVNLELLLGHPTTVTFPDARGGSRDGWFFPGLRGAPTIILCHGYQSQRADVLTLVTALQEHQFNVFLFDFSGHGLSPGYTTLGYRETRELLSAIQALSQRGDVDRSRFGVWGTDIGAYAALAAAESDPRIAALVADSAYDDPRDRLRLEVDHSGLGILPLVRRFCDFGFELVNHADRQDPPLSQRLGRLNGVPKLFIQATDNPELAGATLQLFVHAPEPRQQSVEKTAYAQMTDDQRRAYENLIVNFFLLNLPPTARRAR